MRRARPERKVPLEQASSLLVNRTREEPDQLRDDSHPIGGPAQPVLPDTDHSPAGPAERASNGAVPCDVDVELGLPELAVGGRSGGAGRAAVPEASVNKHRDLLPGEGEVRPARNPPMAAPTADAVPTEQVGDGQFGGAVPASADASHDFRALLLREDVRHGPDPADPVPLR